MEVHPPEHGIHSWRDFLVHMGTITLGLLIALGLEAGAERWHHYSEVREARERLHDEMRENSDAIVRDTLQLKKAEQQLRCNLALLESDGEVDSSKLLFGWRWDGIEASAWDTARATGAVSLMPYEEVQRYAAIYTQQATVTEASKAYIRAQTHAIEPLLHHRRDEHGSSPSIWLTPAERASLIESCGNSLTEVTLLLDLMRPLGTLYSRA